MSGQQAGDGFRFDPVLTSAPGEPVEVTVTFPGEGRPSDEDMFAAMAEAAELLMPGITGLTEDTDADAPPLTLQ